MNDRELLEFIAAQVGNLTSKVDGLGKDMSEVKNHLGNVENRLAKVETTLENEIKPNIKMCLKIVFIKEKQTEHDHRFDNLESKIDNHDIEIKVIKSGKIS